MLHAQAIDVSVPYDGICVPNRSKRCKLIHHIYAKKGSGRFAVMPAPHRQQQALSHADTLQPDHCRASKMTRKPRHMRSWIRRITCEDGKPRQPAGQPKAARDGGGEPIRGVRLPPPSLALLLLPPQIRAGELRLRRLFCGAVLARC